ncbi:hypothetical protein OTK49_02615 [Vibrio coralliirubri]|uniref:hypothetical protein n=1 Tax=Vibrio coralliirubri TaxID=1516159 RepID=UPI002285011E|nr:hypothetical protein [Vibrio coralliirubri]MCY9861410.1 hypothetical protein [Vibrio coralliirubri]
MSRVLEFESTHGCVAIEDHDEHHMFMHSGCISSQMSPKKVSARFFECHGKQYIELADSESGFVQGFELPLNVELREISRFFLNAYGFTPRQEGSLARMPFKGDVVVDSIKLNAGDANEPFNFSLIRSNQILVESKGFYGAYPAQKVGINALENMMDNSKLQLSLTSIERNVSHISLYLNASKQKFEQFLDKYRKRKD